MLKLLFLLFLTVPLIEIYLLIQVGRVIGALPTVGLVILSAVLGALLLRRQGVSTLRRVQGTLQQGQIPAIELVEGLILAFAGALLLTPGFFTDAIGFLCLIPPVRRGLAKRLISTVTVNYTGFDPFRRRRGPAPGGDKNAIDGEFRRED